MKMLIIIMITVLVGNVVIIATFPLVIKRTKMAMMMIRMIAMKRMT